MSTVNVGLCRSVLITGLIVLLTTGLSSLVHAQLPHERDEQVASLEAPSHNHHHADHEATSYGWEGSEEGIAYSERNHHIAGWLVILMGLAELSHARRLPSIVWARFLLPAAMTVTGVFLLIWSDHEAWPIGSLGFSETFFGQDHEIVQHKIYGLLALAVGSIELFRRLGWMDNWPWATPLPLMAIVGGLMLFGHSHGIHPAADKITLHHTLMGVFAITAGSSKLWAGFSTSPTSDRASIAEFVWVGLLLLIGGQLLVYSE